MNPIPRVLSVPSSVIGDYRGIALMNDGLWRVRAPASINTHSKWKRRIEAVVARNKLDHEALMQARMDAAAGKLRKGLVVPVMLPWEVTQQLQDGFDLSQLDDSDETLERLFRNDVTLFEEFAEENDILSG
jgi:hypothetical protein